MDSLLIVCPTIEGREESLNRLLASYERTLPDDVDYTVVTIRDRPTWGEGLAKVLDNGRADRYDYLHPVCDDIECQDGWWEVAKGTVDMGCVPAPYLDTHGVIAYGHPPTKNMSDCKNTPTSVIPFLKGDWWSKYITPMATWHYFTDNFISEKMRRAGFPTIGRIGYRFFHHHEMHGRGGPGMTQDERMNHDGMLYQQWLSTGVLPGGQ